MTPREHRRLKNLALALRYAHGRELEDCARLIAKVVEAADAADQGVSLDNGRHRPLIPDQTAPPAPVDESQIPAKEGCAEPATPTLLDVSHETLAGQRPRISVSRPRISVSRPRLPRERHPLFLDDPRAVNDPRDRVRFPPNHAAWLR